MKEGEVEWCIWVSLLNTFIASVSVSRGIHTVFNTSLQVSFLVLEALGEDGMTGFPGPSNELSRITLPN